MFQYLNLAVLKFSFICFIIFLSSCKQKSDVEIPNVSHINSQLDLVRFDLEIQNKSTDLLIKSYPAFADLYFRQIISILLLVNLVMEILYFRMKIKETVSELD